MKLHHGMTVVIRLDGEEIHLRLTANPAGPGELNLKAPLAYLLKAMQPGDSATFVAPVQDAVPIRVEFIAIAEKVM